MNFAMKSLIFHGRQSSSIIIGLCIGIALSLIQTPFIEDDCSSSYSSNVYLISGEKLSQLRELRSEGGREEDYEPRLVLNNNYEQGNSGKTDTKSSKKLIRPRYYSTELGIKEKLLVAVISSKESIGTYGVAVNKTLNQHVDKLIFFLDGIGTQKMGLNIPVVGFKDSKPLIKIFRILSYLGENYMNDYDYFYLVSDQTYVHGRKLRKMAESISISQVLHMGYIEDNPGSLYCNVDSGILISQSILNAVTKKISWCTRNTYSDTDTDNLGRCILHATDKPCSSNVQGQSYVSYHLREDVDVSSHLKLIGESRQVRKAVTVTNVPEARDMFTLHLYYLQEDLKEEKHLIEDACKEIERVKPSGPKIPREETWPVGSSPSHKPATRFDVLRWDTFNSTHIFFPNDFQNTKQIIGADLFDIMSVINASVKYVQNQAPGILEYRGLDYGHRRIDPTRGVDYIISLAFRDKTSGRIVSKKTEATRPVAEPEMIPMPYVTENNRITLVLPVTQDELLQAVDFVNRYESECMIKGEHTFLLLALLYEPGAASAGDGTDIFKPLRDLALKLTREHHDAGSKVGWVTIHTSGKIPSDFAVIDLVVKKVTPDTLMLLTHHSAYFNNDYLNRVRMNTVSNWQVFSPVPFAFYHPGVIEDVGAYEKKDVNRNVGHFARYNFHHISFYVTDYLTVRKTIVETIPLIRNDKDLKHDHPEEYEFGLYGLFLRASDLHVLRAASPTLKLSYQHVDCEGLSEQQSQFCALQQADSFGLRTQISKRVIDYTEDAHGEE